MVHTFRECGIDIAVDCESGAIHIVDELVRDVISVYKTLSRDETVATLSQKHGISPAEVEECVDEVAALEKSGGLFAPDAFRPDAATLTKRADVVKALCLHVAHTCNLDCEYCFASQGKYHGERALMSFEVGKAALDFLIASSGTRHNLEVDFFGGEPLMNWNVVKRLVAYAR